MNEKDKQKMQKMEELKKAIGISAEMSLLFFRAVLKAGASPQEATALTQTYIAALIYGNRKDHNPE